MEVSDTTRHHIVTVTLNLVYMVFGGCLLGCMIWHHQVALSWAVDDVTGLGVCGVLLILISLGGIVVIFLRRQHFIVAYIGLMAILVVVIGALGGACVGTDSAQIARSLAGVWAQAPPTTQLSIQAALNCCGFSNPNFRAQDALHLTNPSCSQLPCCARHAGSPCCSGRGFVLGEPCPCMPCAGLLQSQVDRTLYTAGVLALVTAMTLLLGTTWLAVQVLQRHREHCLQEERQEDFRCAAAVAPYRRF